MISITFPDPSEANGLSPVRKILTEEEVVTARGDDSLLVRDFHGFGDVAMSVAHYYRLGERVRFYVHYTTDELSGHDDQNLVYPTGWYRHKLDQGI